MYADNTLGEVKGSGVSTSTASETITRQQPRGRPRQANNILNTRESSQTDQTHTLAMAAPAPPPAAAGNPIQPWHAKQRLTDFFKYYRRGMGDYFQENYYQLAPAWHLHNMPLHQGGVGQWPGTRIVNYIHVAGAPPIAAGRGPRWQALSDEDLLAHTVNGPERRIRNLAHALHNALPQGQGRDIRFIRMLGYGGQGVAGLFVHRRHGVKKYFVAKVTIDADRAAGNRELMKERRITRVSSSVYLPGKGYYALQRWDAYAAMLKRNRNSEALSMLLSLSTRPAWAVTPWLWVKMFRLARRVKPGWALLCLSLL